MPFACSCDGQARVVAPAREAAAMTVIAAGIVMLVQPWSIDLYGYSFVTILAGTLGFVIVSHFPE